MHMHTCTYEYVHVFIVLLISGIVECMSKPTRRKRRQRRRRPLLGEEGEEPS
jgi:hypothetical protein